MHGVRGGDKGAGWLAVVLTPLGWPACETSKLAENFLPLQTPATIEDMNTISIQEIQQDPLGCLSRVEAGETLQVVRGAQVVAEIKPVQRAAGAERPFGLCAGQFTVPDGFDQALPEALLDEFAGS